MDWVHCSLTPSNLSHIKVEVKNNQRFVQGHKVVSGKSGPKVSSFVFFKNFYLLNSFIIFGCAGSVSALGLSLVSASRGSSLVVMLRFLIVVACLIAKHGL